MNYKKTILVCLVVLFSLPLVNAASSNDFVKLEVDGEEIYTHKDLVDSRYLVGSDQIFYGSKDGQITMKLYLKDMNSFGDYKIGLQTKSKNITVKSVSVGKDVNPVFSLASKSYDYPNIIKLNNDLTEVTIVIEFNPNEIGTLEEFDVILYNDKGDTLVVYDPFISGFNFRQPLTLNTDGIGLGGNITGDHTILVRVPPGNDYWTSDQCGDGTGITFAQSDEITELDFDVEQFELADQNYFIWVEEIETFPSGSDLNMWFYYDGTCVDNSDGTAAYPADYTAVYHMNETSGNLDNAEGTAAFDGVAVGSATYEQSAQIWDGVDLGPGNPDYFNVGEVTDGSAAGTLIFWVNKSVDAEYKLMGSFDATPDNGYQIILKASGESSFVGFVSEVGGPAAWNVSSTAGVTTDEWFFVSTSWGGAGVKVCVNAGNCGTDANTSAIGDSGLDEFLGARNFATKDSLDGLLDETKIISRQLSDDEIILLYNSEIDNLISFGSEESGVPTANFTTSVDPSALDPENGVSSVTVTLTDASSKEPNITDWNYFIDLVQFYHSTSDGNTTRAITSAGDFNFSLIITDSNSDFSQKDVSVSIVSVPQNIDINFSLNTFSDTNANVDFGVTFTGSATAFNWSFPGDANVTTRNVPNKIFTSPGEKNICVTTTTGDINKTVCENFIVGRVVVKKPLDLSSLAELTPFDMTASANPAQSFSGLSVDTNFFFFSDAGFSSSINVDFNADYFPTSRVFDFTSISNDFIFQPFLVLQAGNLASIIFTIDNINQKQTIPGIKIVSETVISGVLTEVESKLSDITGTAEFHFEIGRDYVLSFFDSDDVLIFSGNLTAKSLDATLFAALAQQTLFREADPTADFNLSWIPIVSQANPVDGNITITNTINPFNTVIGDVNVFISHLNDSNIIFQRIFTLDSADQNQAFSYDINVSGFDDDFPLVVNIQVFDINGFQLNNIRVKNYSFKVARVMGAFESLKEELGAFPVMFFAIVICAVLIGSITLFSPTTNNNWVGVIAMITTAFFVIITWIPIEAWLVSASMGVGMILWRDIEQ